KRGAGGARGVVPGCGGSAGGSGGSDGSAGFGGEEKPVGGRDVIPGEYTDGVRPLPPKKPSAGSHTKTPTPGRNASQCSTSGAFAQTSPLALAWLALLGDRRRRRAPRQ